MCLEIERERERERRERKRDETLSCRETFAFSQWSRTVRESFKHIITFCATKILESSHVSRTHRESVANPLQTHRNLVSAIRTMRRICRIRDQRTVRKLTLNPYSFLGSFFYPCDGLGVSCVQFVAISPLALWQEGVLSVFRLDPWYNNNDGDINKTT